jgi:hypothetical protein
MAVVITAAAAIATYRVRIIESCPPLGARVDMGDAPTWLMD